MKQDKILAWFSAGATSAVACKLALNTYGKTAVKVIYIDTGSAHSDNERFIKACENWYGTPIHRVRNTEYKDIYDVFLKKKYINSPYGAPCTALLKKDVRYRIEDENPDYTAQIFGFEYSKAEINRSIRFTEQYPHTRPKFPLIEQRLTKEDALAILIRAGIEPPIMYRLGYHNNNCIGCVKGGIAYWNKIRRDFPEVFARMATIERQLGATCLKDNQGKIFLDELDPTRGNHLPPIVPTCSIFCEPEFLDIEDPKIKNIFEQ